jgi:hypothetical protein
MSDYFEYVTKATKIYEGMNHASSAFVKGITPMEALWNQHGGIFIAARHPASITDKVAEVSENVAKIVPAWTYDGSNAHTSLPTTKQHFGFVRDEEAEKAVIFALPRDIGTLEIDYFGIRVTPDAVLLAGTANEPFLAVGKTIEHAVNNSVAAINRRREDAKQVPYVFGTPFGPHITMDRFLEKRSPEELKELEAYVKSVPAFGRSRITSVDVGYWITDQAANPPVRVWHVVESIKLG